MARSIWLDFLSRGMFASGEFKRLVEELGVSGVTSNPATFEEAIVHSVDYETDLRRLAAAGMSDAEIYDTLAVEDVRSAAELLQPIYTASDGADGYASLEVSPAVAHDTDATLAEARRLWTRLARPNVFVKVPATAAGVPAIRRLVAEGINVNVTLLFGLGRYGEVIDAYLGGLEERARAGKPLRLVASVASFFLSRVDTLVDAELERLAGEGRVQAAQAPRGEAALALAVLAEEQRASAFSAARFGTLAAQGAAPQRLLWASTGTKNPAYSPVKYVHATIGEDEIVTVPPQTLQALRALAPDARPPALPDPGNARAILARLEEAGIDFDAIARRLEDEGVAKFQAAFDRLMAEIHKRNVQVSGSRALG